MALAINSPDYDCNTTRFIDTARSILSRKEFLLLTNILKELHSSSTLNDTLELWKSFKKSTMQNSCISLNLLSFNVRGFDLRWTEVCLLAKTYACDVILLNEVGHMDMKTAEASFANYQIYYQSGENSHGGVLAMIRDNIPHSRVKCALPNVCIIELKFEQPIRIIALYAPASKTWDWFDLSSYRSAHCVFIGDFNIDLEKDGEKANKILEWMDSCSLGPMIPQVNTSLRANRTIDYALIAGVDLMIQTHEGQTTSDHKPLIGILVTDEAKKSEGCRTAWPVFSLVLSHISSFWEQRWTERAYDVVYQEFLSFLELLEARCKEYFQLSRARPSIPSEIMELLAQSRSLSFKAKRKGDIVLRQEARRIRNMARYKLKKFQQDQLAKLVKSRHSPGENCTFFWNRVKRQFKTATSTLKGFITPNGELIKNAQALANTAADYYEKLFDTPVVVRPHPYVDIPSPQWENELDTIPMVSYPEILAILRTRKKKISKDIHGLSSFLLDKIPKNYWHLFVKLYNYSFANSYLPDKFKEVRMILLAKNNSICTVDQTRPISLLDSFLKIQEKLFQVRFAKLLIMRGILPDNQSGFRASFRLQTRVLLLIEQISSYMANSAPVATVFVDFKSAFDQLWFEGCLGKLSKMGIPQAYVQWIRAWLSDRRAVIEVQGKRSRWFQIKRGGPQGSVFTPTLFITYHSDMSDFIPGAMSFFFADDLAATLAGHMGLKFTEQCLDLERRLQKFLEQLEYYSVLAVQPINYAKTQAMFSARAVRYPNPLPKLKCGEHVIEWTTSYKYLGYWITTKLGWGNIIGKMRIKTRQRTALINSCRFGGISSLHLKRILFSAFVLPHFTWLFGIFPLFTDAQRKDLNHLYFTLLKRIGHRQCWNDVLFSLLFQEKSLDDACYAYWEKYLRKLAKNKDGFLLLEQSELNAHRSKWLSGDNRIHCLYRSKRFVPHIDTLNTVLNWMREHGTSDSVFEISKDELLSFALFPESF
jgi:Reverse transcriptase (RNA-dependent DNA polymerase)